MTAAVAPVVGEYLPAEQSEQLLAKGKPEPVPYVPAAQFKQVTAAVAPVVGEYLPRPQSEHSPAVGMPEPVL